MCILHILDIQHILHILYTVLSLGEMLIFQHRVSGHEAPGFQPRTHGSTSAAFAVVMALTPAMGPDWGSTGGVVPGLISRGF